MNLLKESVRPADADWVSSLEPTTTPASADLALEPDPTLRARPREGSARTAAPVDDEPVFSTRPPAGQTPRPAARVGVDWLSWSATSLVLTGFFILIVSGRVVTEGPVLLVLSATHGIHEGDLFALAAACGGIALPVVRGLRRR